MRRNWLKLIGFAALAAAIGLFAMGCSTDDDYTPHPWFGRYVGGNDWLTLHANGTATWNAAGTPGSMSGITIVNGGVLHATSDPSNVLGEWVYVAINGVNAGIIVREPGGTHIGTGIGASAPVGQGTGANNLIRDVEHHGAAFNPAPVTTNFATAMGGFSFGGSR